MEIIPAIDLRGGRCVRLMQGDYERETVYGDDPVAFALRWQAEGAPRLHVVDLDGARQGSPSRQNLAALQAILSNVDIPVEFGGGVRSLETARAVLSLGVERVVVGTRIAKDDSVARAFFEELGERVVAGIDARDGLVAVDGWQSTTRERATRFATRMEALGARRIIYTDVARDGTEQGPNLPALQAVANSVKIAVVASGGIGSAGHVRELLASVPSNVEGVIVGRALYTGRVTVSELLSTVRRYSQEGA